MSPLELMPRAWLLIAPGGSTVIKLPFLLSRKP
jgi:hypothetical protein